MLRKEASRRLQVRPISTLYRTEQKELHFLKIWAFSSTLNTELCMLAVILGDVHHQQRGGQWQTAGSFCCRLAAMGSLQLLTVCDVRHEDIGDTKEVSDC